MHGDVASIGLGVLAAVAAYNFPALLKGGWYRWVAGVVVAATGVALGFGANYKLAAPLCSVAIVLFVAVRGERHRWGELAGGMSYPLYLNAWVAMFAVNFIYKRSGFVSPTVHEVLVLVACYGLSGLMYWHFDRRILAMRPRLYTGKRARLAMASAYGSVAVGVCVGLALWRGATR